MTNYLRLDDNKKLLIMDRAFDKNRRIVGSKEYDLLQRAMADYPLYTVVLRHIKRKFFNFYGAFSDDTAIVKQCWQVRLILYY